MRANTRVILSIFAIALMVGVTACNRSGSIGLTDLSSGSEGTADDGDGTVDDGEGGTVCEEPTPAASYIYGAGLAKGDAIRLETDVPEAGQISSYNITTDEESIVRYTKFNEYYVYELATEVYGRGWIQPGGYAAFMTPSSMDSELAIGMAIDPAITDLTSYLAKSYIAISFRHRDDGVNFLLMEVDADGNITAAEGSNIQEPPQDAAPSNINLLDLQYTPALNCFIAVMNIGDRLRTLTAFAREGVLLIDMGVGEGFAIMVEQPTSVIPTGIQVGDVYKGFEYKRTAEVGGAANYESTLTVTARPSDDSIVMDFVNPLESNSGVTILPIGDNWPGFFGVAGGQAGGIFLGPNVFIFADNHGTPWGFNYGIAFKE
jgi:hypothetical protein